MINFSSRDLCSNIKNGGGNGRGNGSCSGNLTTQFATEFGSFVFLVTGNLVYKCQFVCRDGSRVPTRIRGLKTTWSGK